MSLTQWNALVEVCRTGSFRAAADTTGFSQPALSRQVAALERSIGVRLLVRGSRGVTPTTAGDAFLPHARLVVSEARHGREAARHATSRTNRVLGTVPSAAASLVPQALRALASTAPGTQWTVVVRLTPQLVEMTRGRQADAAVITDAPPGLPDEKGLCTTHLFDDEMVVLAPPEHHLAGWRRIGIEELADEAWVEDNAGSETLLRQLAVRAGFEARLHRGADDLLTKTGLVAAGMGVALVPGILVPALRSDLTVLRLDQPARRGVYLLTEGDRTPMNDLVGTLITQARVRWPES